MKSFLLLSLAIVVTSGCSFLPKASRLKSFSVKKSWSRDTLKSGYSGYRILHRMQPLIFDDLVIAGNSVDGISAYNKNTGHQSWSVAINGGVDAAALYDGKVYFGANDGYFYALDARSGQKVWTYPLKFEGVGEPLVDEDSIYIQTANHVVYAFDRRSGQKRWIYSRNISSNNSIRGVSKPLKRKDSLFVGFADGYLVKLSSAKGSMQWEKKINFNKKFKDVDAKPVYHNGLILVSGFDGDLVALKESGDTLWRTHAGGASAPVVLDGAVFIGSSDGYMRSIDLMSGKVLWKIKLGRGLPSQVTLFKGLVVVGYSKGALFFLEPSSGQLTGEFSTGRGVSSAASLGEGRVYVMSVNALLYSLKAGWGTRYESL